MSVLRYYDSASQTYKSLPLGCESVAVADWDYSEEEQVVGCWINGKPIYRRAFKLDSLTLPSASGGKQIVIDSNTTYENTINFYGYCNNIKETFPLLWNGTYVSGCVNTSNNLCIYLIRTPSSSTTITNAVMVFEYTKTTDEENSFSVDMLSSGDLDTTATDEEVESIFS